MSRLARRLARCRRWLLCGRYDLHATVRLLLAIGVVFVMADSLYTYFNRPIETAEVRVGIRNSHGMPEMAEEPDNVPVGENDRRACPVSFPYQGVESVRGKPLFTVVPSRSLMNEELATRMEDHTQSQHILCRKLRERYTTALVFACPHPQCVNLMNGLRGLLLAYVLSVLTNRMFFVRPQQWMPLENYLSPPNDWRSIDWTIEGCSLLQEDLRLKHNVEFNIPYSFLRQSDPGCNKILSVLKNRRRAVAMVTDLDVVCAHKLLATQNFELDRRKQRSIYNFAFSRLFRFSDKLVEQAARFEIDNGWNPSQSICIHVRTGSFHGIDPEGGGHSNINDFWHCARLLESAVGLDRQPHVSWMVVGDNDTVPSLAEKFLSRECPYKRRVLTTKFLGVPPQHDQRANAEEMHRIFFDMQLLSKCDYIVGSKSQFVTFAASLGKQTKLFLLVTEKKVENKPLLDVCQQVIPDWDGHFVLR